MTWCSRRSAAAVLAVGAALAARPALAQGMRELQLQGLAIASRPSFAGGGLGLAWRDAGRTRWQLVFSGGARNGAGWGMRGDLAWHFLLDPSKPRGGSVYGGGGISVLAADGRVTPFLLLVLGAESAPGGGRGLFVEVGVGGGARLSLGLRWRKRIAPGR
jgi:hypothetical protein